jgi:hypothetical protein
MRAMVNLVRVREHGHLVELRLASRPFSRGGKHNMYEFAFADAANGYDVELGGWLDLPAMSPEGQVCLEMPRSPCEA